MYTSTKTKEKVSVKIVKVLPAFFYLLIAVAAIFGFFRGESLRYALPIFLIVTRLNMVLYSKYKLHNWGLYVIYALIALLVIFFQF
ncbi:MAG: hypothetical protein NTZ19_12720 [Bacteroidetes bacterium]|nr:hypothetical protein [Bacteroidota bacterium]